MKQAIFGIMLLGLVTLIVGCATQAEFDIRGEWSYTMTTSDGNTYDIGTITFSGETGAGTYLEINIYDVEYEGEYSVNGSKLVLTGGETWEGSIANENEMSGTWSHPDGASGTFEAQRK